MGSGRKGQARAKAEKTSKDKGTSKGENVGEESDGLWSSLPDDIVLKIFKLLPFHHAVKGQAVCRQWRTRLSAMLLKLQLAELEGDILLPVSLPLPDRKFSPWYGYHSPSQRWRLLPSLAFLNFQFKTCHSTHKGLLLLEEGPDKLHVCNPVTRQTKLLPPLPWPAVCHGSVNVLVYHLRVDEDREAYSVLAVTGHTSRTFSWSQHVRPPPRHPCLLRFDSRAGEWSLLRLDDSSDECPPSLFNGGMDKIVELDNVIHTLLMSAQGRAAVVQFHITDGVWRKVCWVPGTLVRMVMCQNAFMVVSLEKLERQICVYRLKPDSTLVLVARAGPELEHVVRLCAAHTWYAVARRSRISIFGSNTSAAGVEYDASSGCWYSLPTFMMSGSHGMVEYAGCWYSLPPADMQADLSIDNEQSVARLHFSDAFELGLTTKV